MRRWLLTLAAASSTFCLAQHASSAAQATRPITTLDLLSLRDVSYNTESWRLGGSPLGAAAPNWQRLSPALNAAHVNAPLLIQADGREYVVSLQLYTELQDRGKPIEMYIYPDEGHIKSQPKHRYAVYNRNVDWFNFWLQDKEDGDPAKRAQYRRWEAMKRVWERKTYQR